MNRHRLKTNVKTDGCHGKSEGLKNENMRIVEQTFILELTPEEYENWVPLINWYIKDKQDQGFNRSTESKPRFQFDANYNRYYTRLKFDRP